MGTAEVDKDEAPLPSWCTFDHGGGMREVTIVKAIEEYLAYHHLEEPLIAFQKDVERAGLLHTPSRASLGVTRDVEDVLGNFDAGQQASFSSAWQRIMPAEFHSSREGRSLELRLQAHFATLRSRQALQADQEPDAVQLQQDLEPFRRFISERGLDEVCGDEALMPLFALPFVQRPHAQPNVKEVFSQRWLQDLRRDVEAALRSQKPSFPLIYDVLEQSLPENGDRAWQSVWAELLRLADTSLDAAALLGQGVPVSPELLTGARQQLELLREHVPGGLELQLKSQLASRPGVSPMSPARSVRSRATTARPQMPREIDFSLLGQFICATQEERRVMGDQAPTLAAVLRAVLQRLASAESPVAQRRGFLVSVACFDVLGVRARPETLPGLLTEPGLAELTLGILAVLACEAVGRSYIVADNACVERMVELLKVKPLDSSLHIQALAAMQRLSLRRTAQDRMIEMGLVEWVVGVLGSSQGEGQGTPSEFSLEFGSAMLMNLALRSAGKRKCVEQDTLTVALNLMEHWNPQIRTHVNGTLYSLLSVSSFRARAKNAGLDGVLRSIHAQATSLGDEISMRQIEYLLEQLNPQGQDQPSDGAESGEDDEDDDENFLEEEELAGLLLGDRSGHSAEEALRHFAASAQVVEAQQREFQNCVGKNYLPTL